MEKVETVEIRKDLLQAVTQVISQLPAGQVAGLFFALNRCLENSKSTAATLVKSVEASKPIGSRSDNMLDTRMTEI